MEVDYPDELHDLHNDCTLKPGKIKILKEYQLQIIEKN